MNNPPIIKVLCLGLFVFFEKGGTYLARWPAGSTGGHASATGALLAALKLIN